MRKKQIQYIGIIQVIEQTIKREVIRIYQHFDKSSGPPVSETGSRLQSL